MGSTLVEGLEIHQNNIFSLFGCTKKHYRMKIFMLWLILQKTRLCNSSKLIKWILHTGWAAFQHHFWWHQYLYLFVKLLKSKLHSWRIKNFIDKCKKFGNFSEVHSTPVEYICWLNQVVLLSPTFSLVNQMSNRGHSKLYDDLGAII